LALLALLLTLPLSLPDELPAEPVQSLAAASLAKEPADAPAAVLRDCEGCDCRSAIEQAWTWLQRHESRLTRLENAQRQCCPPPEEYSPASPTPPPAAAPGWVFGLGGVFATMLGYAVSKLTSGRPTERVCKYASGGVALLLAIGLATSSSAVAQCPYIQPYVPPASEYDPQTRATGQTEASPVELECCKAADISWNSGDYVRVAFCVLVAVSIALQVWELLDRRRFYSVEEYDDDDPDGGQQLPTKKHGLKVVAVLIVACLASTSSAADHHLPADGWRSAATPAALRPLVPVQRDPFRELEDRDGSYKLLQPFSQTAKVEATAAVNAIMASAPQVQYLGLEDVEWKWTPPAPWHACALRLQTTDGSVGSGVYMQLGPNLGGVLTAKHVVSEIRSASQVGGRWIDGQQQRFSAIVSDRTGADLAFLVMSTPRSDVPPLHWTDRAPQPGEYLEAMGYGSGATTLRNYAMMYEGQAYRGKDRTDGQAMHGDSGGGILTLDSLGRVAVCSVVTNGEGQGYQSRGGRYYEKMLFPSPAVVHEFLCDVVSRGQRTRRSMASVDSEAPTLELVQWDPNDPTQCPPGGCPEWYQDSAPQYSQPSPPRQQQSQGRQYEQRDEPIFPDQSPYQIGPQQQQSWGQPPQQPQQGWGQQGGQRQDYCGPNGCPPQQPGWGQVPQQPRYGAPSAPTSPATLLLALGGVAGVIGVMWYLSQD
jgi:hypothetical protein